MRRKRVTGWAAVAILALAILPGEGQAPALTIVNAGPRGELSTIDDADQVRVVFSEAMVPLGAVPPGAPSWIRITPATRGSFYWSGTKTLIFSPEPSARLPFATRFTVRVDGSAASAAGRVLGTPFEFTFTTPAVRVISADWYRQDSRIDRPALIALQFNQPVRPRDVLAHARVAFTPHEWTAPVLRPDARQELLRQDPSGLARFDAKVAAVRRVASSSEAIEVRLATSWDERRFPREATRVVLETTTVPPPDARLTVALDGTLPSPEGPETRPAQSIAVQLEPTFFVTKTYCAAACDPSEYNAVELSRSVTLDQFARALSVADVTGGAAGQPVLPARSLDAAIASQLRTHVITGDIGFPRQPPARTWRLRLGDDLVASDGQTLGYPWVGFIANLHEQPLVAFDGAVWESSAGPQVPVYTRNVSSITQWLERVPLSALMPALRELENHRRAARTAAEGESRQIDVTPDVVQARGLDFRSLLSSGGTGFVRAEVAPADVLPGTAAPDARGFSPYQIAELRRRRSPLVQVTNLGIGVKDSPLATLVFVTRLDTGAPVPEARVSVVDANNQTRWRGTTDRDGVALASALALRKPGREWDLEFVVTAEKDGDAAFVGSNWTDSARPFQWDISYGLSESVPVLRGSVFTDRGVYKETEEVKLKAVVRDDTPTGVRLVPAGRALDVVIRDARGREVDRRTVRVNRWSSVEWSWRVPDQAAFGRYSIALVRAGLPADSPPSVTGDFLVAAFRRPDFRVDATLTADSPVLGSPLNGIVAASYLFGGPLGARPVRWWVRRQPVESATDAIRARYPESRYAVGYLPGHDESEEPDAPRPAGEEMLGEDGRTAILLPTAARDAAYAFTLEGEVTDVSGQSIANRASHVMHPASIYVALSRPPMFVDTRSGTSVGVGVVDLDGKVVGDVPVTVSLLREHWVSTRRPGFAELQWERQQVPAGEWTVRSTAAGEAPLQIPVRDGGSYILRAIARDERGRRTRTDLTFYAIGSGVSAWRSEGNRIDLTPERKTLKPGETARILIQSPWERATGLLTVEREGIRSHRTFAVTSTQDTVEVPVTEEDIPNVYVSVMLVKGRTAVGSGAAAGDVDPGRPSYRVGYTELSVDDASKRLHVKVSSDRDEYRPRQPMKVSVAVSTHGGNPAPGEVTLWAMDYGLLSLTGYTTPDVLKAIYTPKSLQVMTVDNRDRLMRSTSTAQPVIRAPAFLGTLSEMLNVSSSSVSQSDQPVMAAPSDIRTDFRPLVFWLGSATTNAGGLATTTVTLPDSLTTYRIMAVAGDEVSRFGFGEREVRVTKPLTLLPQFPRFLAKGDRASFGAVVTNSGKAAGEAVVTIHSLAPTTVQFDRAARRTFTLAPGASQAVRFEALARATGTARVRMAVTIGAASDAFEMPLTVAEPIRAETTAAYGDTVGVATEQISLPAGVLPRAGGLTVELASTALVGLSESARYLVEYPYECAEQKASRALALALASDLGGAFTISGVNSVEVRAQAARALDALYNYQCGSGGFSMWEGRCGAESTYLTAYVLHVMKVAGTLKFAVDSRAVDSALNYLEQELEDAPPPTPAARESATESAWWPVRAASHAYSLKVLAEAGRRPARHIDRLSGMADRLPILALSYLADALAASNDRGPRYQDILRRLTNAIRINADRAHVEEPDEDALGWLWTTNVSATAVVLEGLSRRRDDGTFAAPLVRWLLAVRRDARWETTHENARALEALVNYYRAFESEVPRMTATVKVGSATAGSAAFNGRSTTSRRIEMPMPALLKQTAAPIAPSLSITRTGTGRLYYTARVQRFTRETPDAVDRGFHVERRYERYVKDGRAPATASFDAGDLIRVTVTVTLRGEGKYLALTDPLPAGVEPIEGWLQTTASDLAERATISPEDGWLYWWRRGTFDHVEKRDDRVLAFATRLASGRHEFSYLVRAATPGTFQAPGARVEAMYAPELQGRSEAATMTVTRE